MIRYQIYPSLTTEQLQLITVLEKLVIRRNRIRENFFSGTATFKEYRMVINTIRSYKIRLHQVEKETGRRAVA